MKIRKFKNLKIKKFKMDWYFGLETQTNSGVLD